MKSPGAALFDGEFRDTVPSEATFRAADGPQPLASCVNMAGLTKEAGACAGTLDPAAVVTTKLIEV